MADDIALFEPSGDGRFMPSDFTRGPWDPGLLHGGPVAALFAEVLQADLAEGSQPVRLTVDLVRPVPLSPLCMKTELVRRGRRLEVHAADLCASDGERLVARATLSAIAPAPSPIDVPHGGETLVPPPGHPDDADLSFSPPASAESFVGGAMEFRFGRHLAVQHGTAWLRLWRPVLPGIPISPLARAAAAADVGNAVSALRDEGAPRVSFVNADLSLSVARLPEGEWIHLESRGRWRGNGIGWVASSMSDTTGEVGAVSNALVLDAMPAGFAWPNQS